MRSFGAKTKFLDTFYEISCWCRPTGRPVGQYTYQPVDRLVRTENDLGDFFSFLTYFFKIKILQAWFYPHIMFHCLKIHSFISNSIFKTLKLHLQMLYFSQISLQIWLHLQIYHGKREWLLLKGKRELRAKTRQEAPS